MKKILFVLLILITFTLAACQSKKDCGSDINCYANSLKKCVPAQYSTSEGDQFAEMEVLGMQGDVCNTEWKSNDGEMVCKIPKQDLNKITAEDLMAGYTVTEICKGSLEEKLSGLIQPLP